MDTDWPVKVCEATLAIYLLPKKPPGPTAALQCACGNSRLGDSVLNQKAESQLRPLYSLCPDAFQTFE